MATIVAPNETSLNLCISITLTTFCDSHKDSQSHKSKLLLPVIAKCIITFSLITCEYWREEQVQQQSSLHLINYPLVET